MKLIQIERKNLKMLRRVQYKKNKGICPILKQKMLFEDSVVDHKHKRKKDIIGLSGTGLIRGVVQFQVNVFEGKVSNAYKRYGLEKYIDLPTLLRNLADYIESPPMLQKYIHPNEAPKLKIVSKAWFNKIQKKYTEKYPNRKILKYNTNKKTGKGTQKLTKLFSQLSQEFCSPVVYLKK